MSENSQRNGSATVYVAYVQQPSIQEGVTRLEVFADRGAAVSWLRAAFDRFSLAVPDASIRSFATDVGNAVAVGVVQAGYASWSGRVVARPCAK